ncbi:Hypothetical_protein [Hexamita inflata]|uniref:Hypothetical_protein n=1 Tax=Hexamita inflata TaxID=28002 RepID=A0AA86TK70_9EUKA|nr:Hypothetical protein HINF_LOCUS5807 [Hexamita inflata]
MQNQLLQINNISFSVTLWLNSQCFGIKYLCSGVQFLECLYFTDNNNYYNKWCLTYCYIYIHSNQHHILILYVQIFRDGQSNFPRRVFPTSHHDVGFRRGVLKFFEIHLKENRIINFSQLQQHSNFDQFQIEDEMEDQYKNLNYNFKIQKKIQIIDTSTVLLQNTSRQRKQINARVNPMKEQISQCLLNLNNNHLQFSRNVVSIFKQLEAGESCQ